MKALRWIKRLLLVSAIWQCLCANGFAFPLSTAAWNDDQWKRHCRGIRTSYNPSEGLSNEILTLTPHDPRWLDFLYWVWNNKIIEHQVEQIGGTGWRGPTGGVIFHWAPGSHWERHTTASFGLFIGHIVGEHGWRDTHFSDFFAQYGGIFGANIKDRVALIDPESSAPWKALLHHLASPESPYYRYVFHQIVAIDPGREKVVMMAGQGVVFEYSYERFLTEIREVLTDCRAYDFFQMYDRFGPGFASQAGWAGNATPPGTSRVYRGSVAGVDKTRGAGGRAAEAERKVAPAVSAKGQALYERECAPCHGVAGDGKGPLAASLFPRPRNFTMGLFRYRSTPTGQLPTDADLLRTVSLGLSGTSMPAWGQFLAEGEMHDIISYIKSFSERFGREPAGTPIEIRPSLPVSDERLGRGKSLFTDMGCVSCHGEDGKGSGEAAQDLKTAEGDPIAPRDLTDKWDFRWGYSPTEIFSRLVTGLDGSPMPSYFGMVSDDELWSVVYYLLSLSPSERPKVTARPSSVNRKVP